MAPLSKPVSAFFRKFINPSWDEMNESILVFNGQLLAHHASPDRYELPSGAIIDVITPFDEIYEWTLARKRQGLTHGYSKRLDRSSPPPIRAGRHPSPIVTRATFTLRRAHDIHPDTRDLLAPTSD